ncbi:hypothetical protein [Phenylobacterium sp.]|uniref:hypothetical protein n=1 Tax=Phenylobacterium sp. TaxID=1871053 RepID=UPI00261306BF|nr:hypothetical protein [Phenylobacterium sp.]
MLLRAKPAASEPGEYKPSGWAIFDQVLGGRTVTDARETLMAREQARRAKEQELDALAAFGEAMRGYGLGGGAPTAEPASPEMAMLSGAMEDAPGPKTYSAPIGPGMDGEPLPGMRLMAPTPPKPLVPGNIDLAARPRVKNPDGSISTISSMSFGGENGEVLIPTIADDGRRLSEAEAIEQYRRTGRHLGIFENPDGATAFAKTLSNSQGDRLAQPRQPASLPAGPPRLPTYRDFAPVLAEAVMSGNPTVAARANALGSVFDKAGPDVEFVNGLGVDKRDSGSVGRFIPSLDKGQEPLFDSNGRIVAIRNMDGSVAAAADMAGAVTGAQERAKAGLDLVEVPQADGSMRMMPRDQAVQAVGGVRGGSGGLPALPGSTGPRAGLPPAGGSSGGFGVRQSPAQQRLETDRAATQASVEAMTPKAMGAYNTLDRKTDFVLETLKKARGQVSGGLGGSAGMNETMAGVPGTNARNLAATLDTLLANLGFNELTEMRANSPTGGAVGSLTERELNLLGSVMGSLDQGQDPDQLVGNIDRMIQELEKAAKERRTAFQSQYGGASASTAQPPPPSKAQLRAGQVYQTPRGPMLWNGKAFVQQ